MMAPINCMQQKATPCLGIALAGGKRTACALTIGVSIALGRRKLSTFSWLSRLDAAMSGAFVAFAP